MEALAEPIVCATFCNRRELLLDLQADQAVRQDLRDQLQRHANVLALNRDQRPARNPLRLPPLGNGRFSPTMILARWLSAASSCGGREDIGICKGTEDL